MQPDFEFDVYVVGGAVRDELLGRDPSDYDYVIVGASEQDLLDQGFKQVHVSGFPVFLDRQGVIQDRDDGEEAAEVALARKEVKLSEDELEEFIKDKKYDSPEEVPHDKRFRFETEGVSLEADLRRRDLTINAMARDLETGEVIDPFGGQDDLEEGVLRHVSEAFREDPLRVVRVATFMARLPDFTIAEETEQLCRELRPELAGLPPERKHREMLKAFRKAESPRQFFDTMDELDALDVMFPWVADLKGVPAGPEKFHQEGSAYEHTMRVLEEAHALRPNEERVLLAALAHDLGKARTDEEILPSHHDHMKTGRDVAKEMVEELKMTREHLSVMQDAVRGHTMDEWNDITMVEFIVDRKNGKGITPEELIALVQADARGREPPQEVPVDEMKERVERARQAVGSVNGFVVMERFDVDQGEQVGRLIHQERVKKFRELGTD